MRPGNLALAPFFINAIALDITPLTPILSPRQRVERGKFTSRSQAPVWGRNPVPSSCFSRLSGAIR